MKKFLSAIIFCAALLAFGLFIMMPSSKAEENLLMNLLNLPAPPPPNPLVANTAKRRPSYDYYINYNDKDGPPGDDAPIEDIIAYWQVNGNRGEMFERISPSEKAMERIMAEIEKDPEILTRLLGLFTEKKEGGEFVKRLYDAELSERKTNRYWRERVKEWLTANTAYFSHDLAKMAEGVRDENGYIINHRNLLNLAKVDFEKAQPILNRLYTDSSQPASQTLAKWALYQNALATGSLSDIERYRGELKKVAEDTKASDAARDLAMDALILSGDFEGRDEWYISLLADETWVNMPRFTGITTLMTRSPADKYLKRMLDLLKSDNPTVKQAAVKNLMTMLGRTENDKEIVKAFLPWLENPKWAKGGTDIRQRIVRWLGNNEMPESLPGLLAVLNEKGQLQNEEIYGPAANTTKYGANIMRPVNTAANAASLRNMASPPREYYPLRDEAIGALGRQKNIQAVGPLRLLLPEVYGYERTNLIKAIFECNGFSIAEQVDAVEKIAKLRKEKGEELKATDQKDDGDGELDYSQRLSAVSNAIANFSYGESSEKDFTPSMTPIILGGILIEEREASAELVVAVLDRIEQLIKKDPQTASEMKEILGGWHGKAITLMFLRDIKIGRAASASVVKLLAIRKELRETMNNDVFDIRSGNPVALGISSCLLEDRNDYDTILNSENIDAKAAMLACARLIRAPLPINKVVENLNSPNKTLALAAERYLESEDSPMARTALLTKHPNEVLILGAREAFYPTKDSASNCAMELNRLFQSVNGSDLCSENYHGFSYSNEKFSKNDEKLRKEIKEKPELLGIYSYDDNFIRIYHDKVTFSWEEDVSRYRERNLEKAEFDLIKEHLMRNNADELKPYISSPCNGECRFKELLMLGRQGGRRAFFKGSQKDQPLFYSELDGIFKEMRTKRAMLHYWLEKYIPGLEVLFADPGYEAKVVWKTGDELQLMTLDKSRLEITNKELNESEESDEKIEYENWRKMRLSAFSWHKLENNKLSVAIGQPSGLDITPEDIWPDHRNQERWKAKAAGIEINREDEGIYKSVAGRKTLIKNGSYDRLVVSADGRWLVASKTGSEEEGFKSSLSRINLQSNKEFSVKFPGKFPEFEAIAFIHALNRFLIKGASYSGEYYESYGKTQEGKYFLLDADTGITQPAKGEVIPLLQQSLRQLQPTKIPNEFWAAMPGEDFTEIGKYDMKTLSFKPLIKLPEIRFMSMEMFADEGEGKIYFVYEGHLLRIPMPKGR